MESGVSAWRSGVAADAFFAVRIGGNRGFSVRDVLNLSTIDINVYCLQLEAHARSRILNAARHSCKMQN